MKQNKNNRFAALLLALCMAVCCALPALAAPAASANIDLSRTGSMDVTLYDHQNDVPLRGGALTVYKVADVACTNGDLHFVYTADFTGCGIALGDLTDSTLASRLEAKLPARAAGTTHKISEQGIVSFDALPLGLYLVVQTENSKGYEAINSFLVSLPMADESGWLYTVDATPKVGAPTQEVTPPEPETPSTPSEPGKPSEPEKPSEPDKPTQPDTPDMPVDPNDPNRPVSPGTPDNPVNPGNPDNPVAPGTPDNPVAPGRQCTAPERPAELAHPVHGLQRRAAVCRRLGAGPEGDAGMNTKQKIGRACMIVGILLILGALALLGYNQWDANRADKASQDALGKLEETLTETMEDKTKDEEPVVQPELDPEQEMTVTDIDGWGYIGYLSIPSIGLELPVMSEWSYAGLKVAPGRYSGSTYADNMVVCAHNYAKHFSPIKWLALGSEVYFTDMDGQRWSYEVSNVETIQPTDIEKMITASDEDAWDLTLFTCTTGGRARCAVRCTRTGYPVLETSAAGRITE